MARYKVTVGLLKYTMGPTESYITPDGTPAATVDRIQDMLGKRLACVFRNWDVAGVRISLVGSKQRSKFNPPGVYKPFGGAETLTVPAHGSYEGNTSAVQSDQIRSVLHTRISYDTDRATIHYFSSIPDGIISVEPASVNFGDFPEWKSRFDTFWNSLINTGWSIRARSNSAEFQPMPITGWVQAAGEPFNLGAVLPSAPAPGILKGQMVHVKGVRRKGTDKLSYNGKYIVSAVNTTLVPDSVVIFLDGTAAGEPASIKLFGTIQRVGYAFYPIQQAEVIRAGIHQRGKPLGTPSGRRQRRGSLDP